MKQILNIYTESNPNPNSLKFVASRMLVPEGISRDYANKEETAHAPLANALFEKFAFVERVFYMSNFVTVTKNAETEWYEVKGEVQHFIKEYLENEGKVLTEDLTKAYSDEITTDDLEARIKGILDEYIKPAVESDGGAIGFESISNGTVTVSLQGSCSGCPSSTITLKSGIENLLKRMVPEVKEVVALEA